MTLRELIHEVEAAGYTLNGMPLPESLAEEVMAAPLVLIPKEPPVEADCRFIENYLSLRPMELAGYARIEGAAATTGAALVKLQFIRRVE